ncbi:MAG: DUF2934 domain-containing protein [Thiobacillaceae bacterium]
MSTSRKHTEIALLEGAPPLTDFEATEAHQQIAVLAYLKAETRGFLPGHELDDWLEAELEINASTPHAEKH